jgi:hypothetical protein
MPLGNYKQRRIFFPMREILVRIKALDKDQGSGLINEMMI